MLIGRTREKLEKVADDIESSGGVCRIEPADVTDEKAIADVAALLAERVVAQRK